MDTDFGLSFNLVEDKIDVLPVSTKNLTGAEAFLDLKSPFGNIISPTSTYPGTPNLNLDTDAKLIIPEIPKYSGSGDFVEGDYQLNWKMIIPNDTITVPVASVPSAFNGFSVQGLVEPIVGATMTVTGAGAGTYTVASFTQFSSTTLITVTETVSPVSLPNGQATFPFVASGSKTVTLAVPISSVDLFAEVSCVKGAISIEDRTPLAPGDTFVQREFVVTPPKGAKDGETGLDLVEIVTTIQKFEVNKITTKRWRISLERIVSRSIAESSNVIFESSRVRNLDISCRVDLCGLQSCLSSLEDRIESLLCKNMMEAKKLQDVVNNVHRLIGIINLSQSCGYELNVDSVFDKICSLLKISGCPCGCSDEESEDPIPIIPVSGFSQAPIFFSSISDFLDIDDSTDDGIRTVVFSLDEQSIIDNMPDPIRGNSITVLEDGDPFPVAIEGDIAILNSGAFPIYSFSDGSWNLIGTLAAADGTQIFFAEGLSETEVLDTIGEDGDLFILRTPLQDTVFYQKDGGAWELIFNIQRQRKIFTGPSSPNSSLGIDGDLYFRTDQNANNPWFEKVTGTWVFRGNLQAESTSSFIDFNVPQINSGQFTLANNNQVRSVFINQAVSTNILSRISYALSFSVVGGPVVSTIEGDNGSGGIVVSGQLGGTASSITFTFSGGSSSSFTVTDIVYNSSTNQTTIFVAEEVVGTVSSYTGTITGVINGAPSMAVVNSTAETLKIRSNTTTSGGGLKIRIPGASDNDDIDFPPFCTAVFRYVPNHPTIFEPFWLLEEIDVSGDSYENVGEQGNYTADFSEKNTVYLQVTSAGSTIAATGITEGQKYTFVIRNTDVDNNAPVFWNPSAFQNSPQVTIPKFINQSLIPSINAFQFIAVNTGSLVRLVPANTSLLDAWRGYAFSPGGSSWTMQTDFEKMLQLNVGGNMTLNINNARAFESYKIIVRNTSGASIDFTFGAPSAFIPTIYDGATATPVFAISAGEYLVLSIQMTETEAIGIIASKSS